MASKYSSEYDLHSDVTLVLECQGYRVFREPFTGALLDLIAIRIGRFL